MSALANKVSLLTSTALAETAAPRKDVQYANPVDFVRKGLLHIMMSSYATFRACVAGLLLNDRATATFETADIGGVLNYDLSSYTAAATPAQLRQRMLIVAGDGSGPIRVRFFDSLTNIQRETLDKIFAYFKQAGVGTKPIPLTRLLDVVDELKPFPEVDSVLQAQRDNFVPKYATPLAGSVDFFVSVARSVFNEDRETDSIEFEFEAHLTPDLYEECVKSEEFSPYLVYLWLNNALNATDRRFNAIIDPRYASRQYRETTAKFGAVRPKVNEKGFCITGSGLPMLVPPSLDRVEVFMKKADSAIDSDGQFSINELIETHKLHNRLIYVDWLNDVMAYTSNQGRLETYDLGEVMPLDAATEWGVLQTELFSPYLKSTRQLIGDWLSKVVPSDAVRWTTNADVKDILNRFSSGSEVFNRMVESALGRPDAFTLAHMCGWDSAAFDEEAPALGNLIRATRACIQQLNVVRTEAEKGGDREAFTATDGRGILAKMIGTEYILQAVGNYDYSSLERLRTEFNAERSRAKTDPSVTEFEIPNLVMGPGFTGLLPHQGRILSSTAKTPNTSMQGVQTGGGKTILSLAMAIFGIKNRGVFPLITTKGRLVKGTITEINALSQGKLNAMPLRPATIRRLVRMKAVNSFKSFVEWYNRLPPNTIFVNSYDDFKSRRRLFDDLDTVDGFGDALTYTTQYMMIIKLLGLRMFIGDESHMIKNPNSGRSRGSYAAFAQGDVRSIMSGTMVSNTVVDLVGQARAVSPYIFGDDPERFADAYDINMGLIKTDEDAGKIKDRLRTTTAYHEANREDWSYMLPTSEDDVVLATLTQRQFEFYNVLMQEALLILEAETKNKRKKVKAEDADDDDDDEDEDDDEDGDEEDAEEARLIAQAKTHLTKVEQFLVAPDANEQYRSFLGVPGETTVYTTPPTGDDLISPKVKMADKLIAEHLAAHANDLLHNKIIVFGWNRVASQHFMRHSKYAAQSLHYVAGGEGEEAVRRYKNNAANMIMVADEGSLREGENLQMTSLILRMQSVWAPGDHEQVKARMYRPDPRGKYNRDSVAHRWILAGLPNGSPSLDLVKMARLVSKFVSNARITYEGRSEWRAVSRELDGLDMLKMNLELIFFAKMDNIQPYIGAWDVFINWENKLNVAAKYRVAQQLEARTGEDLIDDATGRIKDINKFIQLAMFKVTSKTMIPGSKRVYVPWTPGAIPPDPHHRGYVVKGQQTVPNGTVVYTEFGPAVIESELKKGAKVKLYDGRTVGLRNGLIMLVPDKAQYKEFAKIVTDPQRWREEAFDFHGVDLGKIKRIPKQQVEDVPTIDPSELEDEDDNNADNRLDLSEDLNVSVLNGWPALVVMDDIEELAKIKGWNRVDPFVSVSFRSWAIAEKFLDLLSEKAFIKPEIMDALQTEMEELRAGKALVLNQQFDPRAFRNFFLDQRKKLGRSKKGKVVLQPYWIAIESEIRLAFDADGTDPAFFTWLTRQKTNIPGIKAIKRSGAIWINTFRTVREAADDLAGLAKIADFDQRDLRAALGEIKREIAAFRKPRARPDM